MNEPENTSTMENTSVSNNTTTTAKPPYLVLGAMVIALLGIPVFLLRKKNVDLPPATDKNTAMSFKDGTYNAEGMYTSPAGPETILVKVTLKNDKVVDAEATTPPGTIEKSTKYQGMFIGGFKEQVIGKDIATLNLSKVSGSSLTPMGFNDAVKKIQAQAKSS